MASVRETSQVSFSLPCWLTEILFTCCKGCYLLYTAVHRKLGKPNPRLYRHQKTIVGKSTSHHLQANHKSNSKIHEFSTFVSSTGPKKQLSDSQSRPSCAPRCHGRSQPRRRGATASVATRQRPPAGALVEVRHGVGAGLAWHGARITV